MVGDHMAEENDYSTYGNEMFLGSNTKQLKCWTSLSITKCQCYPEVTSIQNLLVSYLENKTLQKKSKITVTYQRENG